VLGGVDDQHGVRVLQHIERRFVGLDRGVELVDLSVDPSHHAFGVVGDPHRGISEVDVGDRVAFGADREDDQHGGHQRPNH